MSRVLTEMFRAQVRRDGGHPAVLDGTRTLSYAELDAASDEVAVGLADCGVGHGDYVAMRLPRSADLLIGILGVLKRGAAYAAFDMDWPAARVDRLVRRLDSRVVIDAERLRALRAVGASRPPAGPAPTVRGGDTAAVFFTSGTTGEPKGVLCPHRAIGRLFPHCGEFDLSGRPVLPLASALPWDVMALELWGALCTGGTALVVRDAYLLPGRLCELKARHGVDTVFLTASVFNLHVDEDLEVFSGLRQVLTGAEQVSADHIRRFLERHPDVTLINGYGPSENGIVTTTHRLTPADCADGSPPIGRAVADTGVHVLDGEIYVSGTGLATGYLGDEAATAERFVEISADGGLRRVYRTGDRGSLGPDGVLHFAGRIDRQVKIRGQRIEPAEVERVAERQAGVTSGAVVPMTDAGGRVTGLALLYMGERPVPELSAVLRSQLPKYLMPDVVQRVDRFPLKPNGKLDHAVLPEMIQSARAPISVPTRQPASDRERTIATIFAEILGLRSVPLDESFFNLGGNSLAAGRLSVRLGSAFGVAVPLSVLFRRSSVLELTDWLAGTEPAPPSQAAPRMEDEAAEASRRAVSVPLLSSQLGFFAAHLADPTEVVSLCPQVWDYTGRIDQAALRAALTDVSRRHEALRSSYTMLDAPTATVLPDPPPVELIEVERPEDVLPALIRPLDLANGQVWRAALAPGRLGLVIHHIAFDGRATSVLAGDLSHAYRARLGGRPPGFGSAVPGLAELAAACRRPVAESDLAAQRAYWRTALGGVAELRLPPGDGPAGRLAAVTRPIDVPRFEEALSSAGVTSTITVLAAYTHAIKELTGQEDIVVGLPVARRDDEVFARAVTCLIDMVCVRLRSPGLEAARTALISSIAHQDVPAHTVARLARRRPLYSTVVSVQDNPEPLLDLPDVVSRHVWVDTDQLDADLVVELLPGGLLRLSHRQEAVSAEFVAALADTMVRVLAGHGVQELGGAR